MEQKFVHQKQVLSLRENINKVIVGKDNIVDLLLSAVIANGHILLEDVPGTGKTMLAKTFAKSLSGVFQRIQFTPDLLPSDVTGINYYNMKEGEFVFRKGPVFGNVVLADEINRATPRTQSSLLECMEERQVTIDGETRKLEDLFVVIATQNPIETAGTFPLPEAQLDRFMFKLSMGYPNKNEEIEILDRFMQKSPFDEINAVCSIQDITDMQTEVKNVYVHSAIKEYIVALADATRNLGNVSIGVSPRGSIVMLNAARAYAYVNGRTFVSPEDIKTLAPVVFAHRLVMRGQLASSDAAKAAIANVLSQVSVPTEDWGK